MKVGSLVLYMNRWNLQQPGYGMVISISSATDYVICKVLWATKYSHEIKEHLESSLIELN